MKIVETNSFELFRLCRVGTLEDRFETKALNFEADGLRAELRDKVDGRIYIMKIKPTERVEKKGEDK